MNVTPQNHIHGMNCSLYICNAQYFKEEAVDQFLNRINQYFKTHKMKYKTLTAWLLWMSVQLLEMGFVPEVIERPIKASDVKLQERGLMMEEGETRRPEERMCLVVAVE